MKIFPENSDIKKLKRIKFGIDPTFNRLHLGHLVILSWLRNQEKKDVTIIIGNITGRLGDPSGRDKTRPILTGVEIHNNIEAIEKQIKRILPWVRIRFQPQMSAESLLEIASNFTVTKMMSRDGFQKRESVSLHELMVPILQAMDSVYLNTELELGGEDQLFNFELTREVQKLHGQKPQVCAMFPIISGTDGNKMSKSKDNCIWLDDPQIDKRILGVSDEIMDEWFPLFCPEDPLEHPFERKKQLARYIKELL